MATQDISFYERKLRRYQSKINTYFMRVQSIYNSMSQLDTPQDLDIFMSNASTIDLLRTDFITTLDERNDFAASNTCLEESNYDSLLAFEDLYARVKFKYSQLLVSSNLKGTKLEFNKQSPKLPRLELCSFNGEFENWPIFYETFRTAIHENTDLSEGEKLQYLLGKLTGKAQSICHGFMPTAENYSVLWNTLVSKYNDKRVLASSYLDKLLNLPTASETSPNNLEMFVDKYSSLISSLKQLKIDSLVDFIFIHIGSKKIDLNTLKSFEMQYNNSEVFPTSCQFVDFLRNQSRILQRTNNIASMKSSPPPAPSGARVNKNYYPNSMPPRVTQNNNNKSSKTFVIREQSKCVFCGNTDHFQLYVCSKFKLMCPQERYDFVKLNKCCVNCLSKGHTVRQCKVRVRCNKCLRSHHSLLHFPTDTHNNATVGPVAGSSPTSPSSTEGRSEQARPVALCALEPRADARRPSRHTTVLLGTAQCNVIDALGNVHVVRVLVDSASQRDLITLHCCQKLNLQIFPSVSKSVCGVGDVSNPIEGYTCLTLRSRIDDSVCFTIEPLVTHRITSELPTVRVDVSRLEYLNNISLADYTYSEPANIDLIVGSDLFARILRPNIISRSAGEPVAIETLLGYVIYGQAPVISPDIKNTHTYCTFDKNNFECCIRKFFELEEVPNSKVYTPEEQLCESSFCETAARDSTGRYIVSLPFKDDANKLGDSMQASSRSYLSLERKLLTNPSIKIEYDKVFKEYLDKGYLRLVNNGFNNDTHSQYVIPHHAVVRTDKTTTKLRVVLDASMKTTSGLSLNDILLIGPNLQNNLFEIILNFRLYEVAISADIRQMYMQILMQPEDWKFQRVLYRFNPDEPIQVYEMTRVPFGLCCSPYLALRTVRQLATDEGARFPLAAQAATRDSYMDDLATSCADEPEAIRLARELINLFKAGGFELVKFCSNSPEVLSNIPSTHRVSEDVEFSTDNYLKILGLRWLPSEDMFSFNVNVRQCECTKRNILSAIGRLWDIMGYVAPVTILAKLIIKSLWANNIGWDDTPPQDICTLWQRFESELPVLESVKIPRHVGVISDCIVTILGFADASESAYGGVVYLHVSFPQENRFIINLVCAKSRVAPMRNVSLARLELCGNLTLAKLIRVVLDTYSPRVTIHSVFAFSDSTVALAWIHSPPSRWQTFIANRVTKIQDYLHPSHFHFVSGKENPADCLSRGLTPAQLADHPLWFHGPRFAQLPTPEWPVNNFNPKLITEVPESKPNKVLAVIEPKELPLLYSLALRVSSWPKLIRIIIYILKFTKVLPKGFNCLHFEYAELLMIKTLQHFYYEEEFKRVELGRKLPPAFGKLKAFVHNGMFRVGGRLSNANLNYDSQHPILLPPRDHVVNLIIDYYHNKYLHTGPQLLLSLLRQKYWILSARNIVRQRVQSCNICFKTKPHNEFPIMADLPACRVQEAKAFFHTGIDYAGPLHIVPYRRRGVHSIKAYICLFVCLVTKAVHIELCSDLSTEVFLLALKRFLSRRGPVKIIYSDCGTNFIGAKSYLDEIYKLISSEHYHDKFANELRERNIDWKFNPPSSPHFGGVWEGNIRCVKMHLHKVVGNQLLTFEEMTTVLTQIEAILNSRPLSVLSPDPSEPLALTPAHFLTLTPLKSFPSDTVSGNVSLVGRKRMVDALVQSFWRRWKLEYLNTLQTRQKWLTDSKLITKGSIVLLQSDNSSPLDWPLGIVEDTFPGNDGVVRVVNVRTKSGVYRRPVVKIFPLPTQ